MTFIAYKKSLFLEMKNHPFIVHCSMNSIAARVAAHR
jgi:hypothetical protein